MVSPARRGANRGLIAVSKLCPEKAVRGGRSADGGRIGNSRMMGSCRGRTTRAETEAGNQSNGQRAMSKIAGRSRGSVPGGKINVPRVLPDQGELVAEFEPRVVEEER